MMRIKHITPIVKLDLKLKCWSQDYVIRVMHTYIPFKGTIPVIRAGADSAGRALDINHKQAIFKNCIPFTTA